MLDSMESEYFKLGLMKGISRKRAVYTVALRNASIPIVTLLARTGLHLYVETECHLQ
jgi:peptide/nickel transport system permease protein